MLLNIEMFKLDSIFYKLFRGLEWWAGWKERKPKTREKKNERKEVVPLSIWYVTINLSIYL